MEKNKDKDNGNKKDREEYGYGYDRSVDDLKVIGQNDLSKNSKETKNEQKK